MGTVCVYAPLPTVYAPLPTRNSAAKSNQASCREQVIF